ncbi:DUF1232 domain-containing protein [Desulfovibrio piger]|nr:DUF1232 domain-containing protein [Desulfovibrio piger]
MRLTRDSPVSGTSCPRSMILYMYGGSSLHPDGRDPAGSCGDTGKDCGVRERYFILPADAIPDVLPAARYVDDLGVLAAALITVSMYIDNEVTANAEKKVNQLLW